MASVVLPRYEITEEKEETARDSGPGWRNNGITVIG